MGKSDEPPMEPHGRDDQHSARRADFIDRYDHYEYDDAVNRRRAWKCKAVCVELRFLYDYLYDRNAAQRTDLRYIREEKKVLAVGILIFLVGSILCGMASSMLELVLYRGVQGLGAGAMIAFPAIIAGDLFSVEARGKIQALFTGMWGLSAVLAPLLGSLFIERLTWRWIFYINIPICLASLLLLIPYREVYQARKSTINYTGSLLFGLGIGLLLLNTVVAEGYLLYTVLGLLFMALFIWNERRHPSPIVPMELMRNGTVA